MYILLNKYLLHLVILNYIQNNAQSKLMFGLISVCTDSIISCIYIYI